MHPNGPTQDSFVPKTQRERSTLGICRPESNWFPPFGVWHGHVTHPVVTRPNIVLNLEHGAQGCTIMCTVVGDVDLSCTRRVRRCYLQIRVYVCRVQVCVSTCACVYRCVSACVGVSVCEYVHVYLQTCVYVRRCKCV